TLAFFSPEWHKKLFYNVFGIVSPTEKNEGLAQVTYNIDNFDSKQYFLKLILLCFFLIQIFLPIRHLFFTNENIRWTQDYYRYGWRVMLVEHEGLATFNVQDPKT